MSSTTRYAAVFAAGLAAGLLLGWLLRDDAATSAAPPTAASEAGHRATPPAESRAPRRRAADREEPAAAKTVEDTAANAAASSTATPVAADPSATAVAATTTSPAPAADAPREAAPASREEPNAKQEQPAREARGVVIDAATQKPVTGARVLFAIATGPRAGSWWGDTTAQDGRFHNRVDDSVELTGMKMELRVSKEGYEPVRVAAEGDDLRVELRPRTTFPVPARVVGLARGADGKPLTGEIEVNGYDGEGANATQWTMADAAGAFVLEGVPPGSWRLQIGSGPSAEVTVAEGGEARVELTAGTRGDGFVVTDLEPSKVQVEGAHANEALTELRRLYEQTSALQSLDAGTRERLLRQFAQEIQQVESSALASAPRREVAITGLPTTARTWLRLELRPRHFRRVEVQGGVARFAAVPLGKYQAVLVEPGRPDRTMNVVVETGDGRLDLQFR